jgi:pyrrolysyl-tRNA synthetase-like protein
MMTEETHTPQKRYIRKRVDLFRLINKIKLWPSRKGILHGIRNIERFGKTARVTTHCNRSFFVNNSRNSRAARWLRNKLFVTSCEACAIPDWKLGKYHTTHFSRHAGSQLTHRSFMEQATKIKQP